MIVVHGIALDHYPVTDPGGIPGGAHTPESVPAAYRAGGVKPSEAGERRLAR